MKNKEQEPKQINDDECLSCTRLFTCEGKPVDVRRCINYKGRSGKHERD